MREVEKRAPANADMVDRSPGETVMPSSDKIAFGDRPTCTIRQATEATGLGRSTIYQRIADEQLLTYKVGRRRLIVVKSLLALVGADPSTQDTSKFNSTKG
jgi:excisionase family DNA binding protein